MDVDGEESEVNGRWSRQEDSGIVWCNSAEAVLQAVADNQLNIEVGACEEHDGGPEQVMQAIEKHSGRLESLSLTGCNLDAPLLARLGAALEKTQIMGVGVSNNPDIDVGTWSAFWGRLPSTVSKWDFGDDGLADECLPPLVAALQRVSEVRELLLDGNNFADIRPILPIVAESAFIAELDIGDNNIGDAHAQALAGVLPNCSLTALCLGRNPIGDSGGVAIAYAIPRSRIEILHLDDTQVGDETLNALADVLSDAKLVELHLDGTKITDSGAVHLCKALPGSGIAMLDIGNNNISEETAARIEAALPEDTTME